jgi:hypothetical protein
MGRSQQGRLRTKTLAWRKTDEAVLLKLRARVAARFGLVVTERDLVSAALRLALRDPSGLGLARPLA